MNIKKELQLLKLMRSVAVNRPAGSEGTGFQVGKNCRLIFSKTTTELLVFRPHGGVITVCTIVRAPNEKDTDFDNYSPTGITFIERNGYYFYLGTDRSTGYKLTNYPNGVSKESIPLEIINADFFSDESDSVLFQLELIHDTTTLCGLVLFSQIYNFYLDDINVYTRTCFEEEITDEMFDGIRQYLEKIE